MYSKTKTKKATRWSSPLLKMDQRESDTYIQLME